MKRRGVHRPSVEDVLELSGVEILHPGGLELTRRTAELAGMRPGLHILDVSSGRGTQAVYYAKTFGVQVTGVDLSESMVSAARKNARLAGLSDATRFEIGDSQALPFAEAAFDAVINECAVGIPDDSQAVLNEMVRVAKPGAPVVIHESTWRKPLSQEEKDDFSERYGTTPLERTEWVSMLEKAGVQNVQSELEPWSRADMFWNIRQDRSVSGPSKVLTPLERIRTMIRVARKFGLRGVSKANENARVFFKAVLAGTLGYGLYWGAAGS